ncbi:MAG: hypothetical protein V9G19_05650 [Tetrasphaera sp.]
MRRGAPRRPSLWRLLPLAVGAGVLTWVIHYQVSDTSAVGAAGVAKALLAGIAITGLSVPIAVPPTGRAVADLGARWSPSPAIQLAARTLQTTPTATARVIAGLAVSSFLVTGALGVLTAFESVGQYRRPAHAIEHGPQHHHLGDNPWEVGGPTPTPEQAAAIRDVDGVLDVHPDYSIWIACKDDGIDICGEVFVGSCAQLALRVVVPDCRDGIAALLSNPDGQAAPRPASGNFEITRDLGNTQQAAATLAIKGAVWDVDIAATQEIFPDDTHPAAIVPPDYPGLASLAGEPTAYEILSGPGFAVRDRLTATTQRMGLGINLQPMEDYDVVNGYAVLLWTLAAIVLGIGLTSVLLTAIDHAVERRRQVAAQRALGVPGRILRLSQALQVLVPLVVGQLAAIALGYLALSAYLGYDRSSQRPTGAVVAMLLASLVGAAIVAGISVLGLGRGLTPQLLRRE